MQRQLAIPGALNRITEGLLRFSVQRHSRIVFLVLCAAALTRPSRTGAAPLGPPNPRPSPSIVEQGKFVLHKFEQPIGEETYRISRDGDSLETNVDFKFTDRGTPVSLTTTFRSAMDLTPESFEIKGKNSRVTTIDEAIGVQAAQVRLRDRDKWTSVPRPANFFAVAGYAPATMQMLLVRYWTAHGMPADLATLPAGHVRIEPRGTDAVSVAGRDEQLERYTIEGLIWGRETLWLDASRNLVALVTTDAEFDHFEAIREGYESALGAFVARAGTDEMQQLAELPTAISGSRADVLALVGGTLIDGTGHAPLRNATVLIGSGRIIAVGPRRKVKIPRGATKINAHHKFMLPGLWDMHAHFEQVEWGPIYLAAGVTTVRDCGNEFEFITAVRDAISGGKGLGPRLLLAGLVDGSGPLALGVQRVDAPEQAKMWVDRYHGAGFQQIKIYSSVKLDEIRVITNEAHRLGMTVTGHVPEGVNAYEAIEAGQDQINHITYIADIMHRPFPRDATRNVRLSALANLDLNSPEARKAIAFLAAHGTVIDPTLVIFEFETASTAKPTASFEPGVLKVAPELRQQLVDVGPPSPSADLQEKLFRKEVAIVGVLHRAGVPIVAGTDQTVPGYSVYREIELYTQAGLTPMEAIQAATIVPARVMRLDKESGTIEAGKRADLILLTANPLKSIHNIRSVKYVIANGRMYNCADLWRVAGFQP